MKLYEISGIPENEHVFLQRYLRDAAGRACIETKVDPCAIFFDIKAFKDADGQSEEHRMVFTTCRDVYDIDDVVDPERVVEIAKYSMTFAVKEYDFLDSVPMDDKKPNVIAKAFSDPVKWGYRIIITVQKVMCVNDGGIDWEQSDRLRLDIINKLIECISGTERLSVNREDLDSKRDYLTSLLGFSKD